MIENAQGQGWKTFKPISVIKHPILKGKYLAIDGNHRLAAFKIGQIPQINTIVIGYEHILLADPDTKWYAGIVPKTFPLRSAINNKHIDLNMYFTTKDLQVLSRINDEPTVNEWFILSDLREHNVNINTIVRQYLNSAIGRKCETLDCKSVTRAFIQWAAKNGMQAQALLLAPPSAEFIEKNPRFQGKYGNGDSHIMPVINGYAVDFTARQFGLNVPYNNPLITPIGNVESVYKKFGYYTDNPEWFDGGKSFYLGPWTSVPFIDPSFEDEILSN